MLSGSMSNSKTIATAINNQSRSKTKFFHLVHFIFIVNEVITFPLASASVTAASQTRNEKELRRR